MIAITKQVRTSLLALLVVTTGFAGQAAWGSSVVVGNCRALTTFLTINAAVAAVPSGSTIYVCPGTYAEQVVITKKLSLIGYPSMTGGDAAIVVPPSGSLVQNGTDIFGSPVAAQIFVNSPSGPVTIRNLTVDGTGNNLAGCGAPTLEGIYFQNTAGTISDNVVRNQFQSDFATYGGCQNGLAINVESASSAPVVTISANSVRAYQKNGITATGAATGPGSLGPSVTILANYIVGLAATAMNWPGGAAENGIQVGFGASGKITNNVVNDNIWYADDSTQPGNAAAGILVYASPGITIQGNNVGSAQFGITTDSDPFYGPADTTIVMSNRVSGTQIFDAIDLCSSSNTVTSNTIYGSAQSGIHFDDTCGSSNNNTARTNTVNEACAAVLLGNGTNNNFSPITVFNVANTSLAGDVCPAAPASARMAAPSSKPRPSPYMPGRK